MSALVEDLLLLARLDEGRPLEREPVELDAVVGEAVETAQAVEPARPIELHAEPAAVVGDRDRLRQIVDNLLANARAHASQDARGRSVAAANGNAVVEVSDRGPGIEAGDAERIFERFYRTDSSRSRESGGVGLGLSIVAAVAEAHGGTVAAESPPGGGATFGSRSRWPTETKAHERAPDTERSPGGGCSPSREAPGLRLCSRAARERTGEAPRRRPPRHDHGHHGRSAELRAHAGAHRGPVLPRPRPRARGHHRGRPGLPFDLRVLVVDADSCEPTRDAAVDLWHCDAGGQYSGVEGDTGTFLRGIQMTDADGAASFRTVFPGWYSGRAVHIHVKVNLSGAESFTGQLFFDGSTLEAVYADEPYAARGPADVAHESDGIYAESQGATVVDVAFRTGPRAAP